MARERTIKKRNTKGGKLSRSDVKRAVREVIGNRRSASKVESSATQTPKATTIKVGRDVKTGKFISCNEAKHRKNTAVVETIRIPKK